jgi:anti-anti-sigma factor
MIAKTETLGGCTILRVSGRIDFESALDFEHQINAMIQEPGDCYIIELSQVELLSSAGLRVMLSTAKRVAHRNAALALAAPSQVVRQVFEISHFNLLFKIFPSVPAAIAALKGTAEVIPPEGSSQDPAMMPGSTGLEETKLSETVLPTDESIGQAVPSERVRAALSGSLPPASPLPASPRLAERTNIAQPPLPAVVAAEESTKAPAATVVPNRTESGPPRQSPPPLPSANQLGSVSPSPIIQPPGARAAAMAVRREAKYPALLEVRAEGTSYPCKDGDVIGTEGRLAQPYFSQIAHLAPRHLLIGLLEGRWFVFTPQNVQHPFILDGVALRPGERKMLQYVEHQVEFSGHVFGFRLVAEPPKEGFFARMFGRKK